MKQLYSIYFSPTGTSKKVASLLNENFPYEEKEVDLCLEQKEEIHLEKEDLAIISLPCYGGRIPQLSAERLKWIYGDKTPAILCVTFGNRAYEDALLELSGIMQRSGFLIIAACAIATEHNVMHVFGTGRPDENDEQEIKEFGFKVLEKIKSDDTSFPNLPGNRPYKEWGGMKIDILTDMNVCLHCSLCVRNCPVQAIDPDTLMTNQEECISCMRCIANCPKKCRSLSNEFLSNLIKRLENACKERKKNEFFLSSSQ